MMDVAKFEELYKIWTDVANDIKKIELKESLNSPHAFLVQDTTIFPREIFDLKRSQAMVGKKLQKIMDVFIDRMREHQREIK